MTDSDFLEKLKKLCLEYDSKAQSYPESPFEGFAIYYFALHPDHKFDSWGGGVDIDFCEGGKEYKEELNKLESV